MDAAAASGAVWTPRPINDLKISSIYNRSATEAPAEVICLQLCSDFRISDAALVLNCQLKCLNGKIPVSNSVQCVYKQSYLFIKSCH